MTELTVVQLVSVGLATIACGWDLRTRRIPQVLTLGGAVAGVAFHLVTGGLAGRTGQASRAGSSASRFSSRHSRSAALARGDVKLLGALGAWLGPTNVLWLALYTGVAGGVMALARRGRERLSAGGSHERVRVDDALAPERTDAAALR